MHKYKIPFISNAERERIYAAGKRAFSEGKRRGYSPYTAINLALAIIWWNGWDTGEEEGKPYQKPERHLGCKDLAYAIERQALKCLISTPM